MYFNAWSEVLIKEERTILFFFLEKLINKLIKGFDD